MGTVRRIKNIVKLGEIFSFIGSGYTIRKKILIFEVLSILLEEFKRLYKGNNTFSNKMIVGKRATLSCFE